jgi:hypothetical protein
MDFKNIFLGQPNDPIEFLYRENWITLSSIGSIFTFGLISNFRANVFDKIMGHILPVESFDFMKVEMADIGPSPPIQTINPFDPTDIITTGNPNIIEFGLFVREAIIWIFMILVLYIACIFIRWPASGGIDFNSIHSG